MPTRNRKEQWRDSSRRCSGRDALSGAIELPIRPPYGPKVFIARSGCFTMVNRGRSMQSRAMERALADSGEMQRGSNMGKGQVRAADFFLEPNIVTSNNNSGGSNIGGTIKGVGRVLAKRVA